MGMNLQRFNRFPPLSVGRNVLLAPRLVMQTDLVAATAQARALADRRRLVGKFDAWPDQLAGRQQQRVDTARALATPPSRAEPGAATIGHDHSHPHRHPEFH